MGKKKKKTPEHVIADNRKARHDYHLDTYIEAGLVLEGWEVKSLREGRAQLKESYVKLQRGEVWLIGAHISPSKYTNTHTVPDPTRTRKLLLNQKEIEALEKGVKQQGFTIVPVNLHWRRRRAKLDIALAKGKQSHDKRASDKARDWNREKQRLMKQA